MQTIEFRDPLKLAISMTLFYALALTMNWDMPKYGGLAIVLISLGTVGASLQKGLLRIIGTTAGVLVGFIIIANFYQDRWATMASFAFYLFIIGYMMQRSRYQYAWYVAGFVPLIVWAVTYNHIDSAFEYGFFRYLETTTGVVIYTVVCAVLWPKKQTSKIYARAEKIAKAQLEILEKSAKKSQNLTIEARHLRAISFLPGKLFELEELIKEAFADTIEIASQKKIWKSFLSTNRELTYHLLLWEQMITDCPAELFEHRLSGFQQSQNILKQRFSLICTLLKNQQLKDSEAIKDDCLRPINLNLKKVAASNSNLVSFALLNNCIKQLEKIDEVSLKLLNILLDLIKADIKHSSTIKQQPIQKSNFTRPVWDLRIFKRSFYPMLTFTVGFIFWIYFNPPPGPNIPMMSGILGLSMLLTPFKPHQAAAVVIPLILFIIAPIYFLILPSLTGYGLLALIFCYTLIFGLIGERWQILKTLPIILFVMLTNIHNGQSFSFNTISYASIMIIVSLLISGLIYMLLVYKSAEERYLGLIRNHFKYYYRSIEYLLNRNRLVNHHYFSNLHQVTIELSSIKIHYFDSIVITKQDFEKIKEHFISITMWFYILGNQTPSISEMLIKIDNKGQAILMEIILALQDIFSSLMRLQSVDSIQTAISDINQKIQILQKKHEDILSGDVNVSQNKEHLENTYVILGAIFGLLYANKKLMDTLREIKLYNISATNEFS